MTIAKFNGIAIDDTTKILGAARAKVMGIAISSGGGGGFTTISDHPTLTTNLVSYWDFDSNANDIVGSNNGTVNGATSTTGILGNAYDFDGVNDYITFAGTYPGAVTSWSIGFWINWQTVSPNLIYNSDGTSNEFLNFRSNGSTRDMHIQTQDSTGNRLDMSAFTVPTGWHLIVLVKDKSNDELNVYLDGNLQESKTDTRTGNWNLDNWTMGVARDNFSAPFGGDIDETFVFTRSLTPAEVSDLYNGGSSLPYD